MKEINKRYDIAVVGGGLAGVCAAIAAARSGCSVALIQDRSVLGGNSSSEIRVAIGGSDIDFLWARETGIIEELRIEDRYRNRTAPCNRNGWVGFMWDVVLYEKVMAEENFGDGIGYYGFNLDLYRGYPPIEPSYTQIGIHKG